MSGTGKPLLSPTTSRSWQPQGHDHVSQTSSRVSTPPRRDVRHTSDTSSDGIDGTVSSRGRKKTSLPGPLRKSTATTVRDVSRTTMTMRPEVRAGASLFGGEIEFHHTGLSHRHYGNSLATGDYTIDLDRSCGRSLRSGSRKSKSRGIPVVSISAEEVKGTKVKRALPELVFGPMPVTVKNLAEQRLTCVVFDACCRQEHTELGDAATLDGALRRYNEAMRGLQTALESGRGAFALALAGVVGKRSLLDGDTASVADVYFEALQRGGNLARYTMHLSGGEGSQLFMVKRQNPMVPETPVDPRTVPPDVRAQTTIQIDFAALGNPKHPFWAMLGDEERRPWNLAQQAAEEMLTAMDKKGELKGNARAEILAALSCEAYAQIYMNRDGHVLPRFASSDAFTLLLLDPQAQRFWRTNSDLIADNLFARMNGTTVTELRSTIHDIEQKELLSHQESTSEGQLLLDFLKTYDDIKDSRGWSSMLLSFESQPDLLSGYLHFFEHYSGDPGRFAQSLQEHKRQHTKKKVEVSQQEQALVRDLNALRERIGMTEPIEIKKGAKECLATSFVPEHRMTTTVGRSRSYAPPRVYRTPHGRVGFVAFEIKQDVTTHPSSIALQQAKNGSELREFFRTALRVSTMMQTFRHTTPTSSPDLSDLSILTSKSTSTSVESLDEQEVEPTTESVIASIRQDRSWNGLQTDVAPFLMAELLGRPIEITSGRGLQRIRIEPRRGIVDPSPISLANRGNHYYMRLGDDGGDEISMHRDGNCFFQAVAMNLTTGDIERLGLQRPVSTQDLREALARHIEYNTGELDRLLGDQYLNARTTNAARAYERVHHDQAYGPLLDGLHKDRPIVVVDKDGGDLLGYSDSPSEEDPILVLYDSSTQKHILATNSKDLLDPQELEQLDDLRD